MLMLYNLLKPILILIFKILFRIKVYGRKYIPKKGGFILASNHSSFLDPMALGVACPRRLNFMARHDLFYRPFFSWLITTLGAFPVKRDSADVSSLKEAMKRLKEGKALVLFPAGTRGFEGLSTQTHAGIGFLVSKLDVPIIPAFIRGTEEVLPKGSKVIRFKKISVYFGEEIPIERRRPYQAIAQTIMEEIRRLA